MFFQTVSVWKNMRWLGETLTDFIHGDIKSFQFGAFDQEVGGHALHIVLAQIKRLDLRQTKRHMQLVYTVTEGEMQMSSTKQTKQLM